MLTNIVISQLPQKQTYFTGETELDLTGGVVCLIGEGGQYEQVMMSDPDIRCEWSSEKAGASLVTVCCQDKTAQFQVTIKEPMLKRMSVISPPQKRTYAEGEMLDLTGLRLMGEYEGGLKREITNIPEVQYQVKKDDKLYSLSIGSATIPLYFKVETAKLVSIHMGDLPHKLEYLERAENFCADGGTVIRLYDNGREETVALNADWVTGFTNETSGSVMLLVQTGGAETSFEVMIRARQATCLRVTKNPEKRVYIEGQPLDFTGMELQVVYDNGETAIVEQWSCDKSVAAVNDTAVTVLAEGMTAMFTIQVEAPSVVGIKMKSLPDKLKYAKDKDLLLLDGASLVVSYNNGSEKIQAITEDMVTGFDNSKAGECWVNVQYQGFTTAFAVEISASEMLGLLVSQMPYKTVYAVGERFESEGMEISGFYSDGLMKIMENYVITPDRALESTDIAVVVEAEGKTLVVPIFVQQ